MLPDPVLLAFDTAAAHCAAVVVQGAAVLAERVEPMQKGQAERLFPMMEELLAEADVDWKSVDGIGVGVGPGNFTGIRISVSAARGLSLSLGVPAIGVSRLEAMAYGLTGTALIDARQGRAYRQVFQDGVATGAVSVEDLVDLQAVQPIVDAPLDVANARLIPVETCLRNVATLALARLDQDGPRPAPLYVRAPDAALPADPPPTILP